MTLDLAVIIPALDAAATLAPTLDSLAGENAPPRRVVVVDGGSSDQTAAIAEARGATVLRAARGRGVQLDEGARATSRPWLLFVHADTALERGWSAEIARFIDDPANADRAGYFRFALDHASVSARRLEAVVAWRCRVIGLPYGDQGLLMSAEYYRALGGFRPLALMEDVDMARRIGRARLVALEARAVTSAGRYRAAGFLLRSARNLSCLTLYFLGVPTGLIARLYG